MRRRFPEGSDTANARIFKKFACEPLKFNAATLNNMTRFIAADVINYVPKFAYWECDDRRRMSRPDNITGYVQRAWEFYWAIRLGAQTGNVCLGIGTGGINSPAMLTTDRFCGESPHPIRYPHPNGYSHMTLDADTTPWPFNAATLGGVIFNHSFEHLENQAEAIVEAYRVTKPGGAVCICQPCMAFNSRGTIDPTHTTEWAADPFLEFVLTLDLPGADVVAHNSLGTDFSFDTVILKQG